MSRSLVSLKDVIYWIFFVIIIVLIGAFFVVPFIKERNLVNFFDKIQNSEDLSESIVAVQVKYEGEKDVLVDYNGRESVHPGSNFKLFTAAASLHYLGPDFVFKTRLYIKKQGKKNDIFLIGGGDPSFKQNDFRGFVEKIKSTGNIVGDIYYDDRYFEGEKFGPDWSDEWKDQYFAVPITGLQINDNLLDIRGGQIGDTGKFGIETKPLENYSKIIDNRVYYDNGDELKQPVTATMDDAGVIVLHGDTMENLPFRTSTTVKDPSLMAALVLKQELLKENLVSGNSKILSYKGDEVKDKLILIYEHNSQLLADLILQMLKFSKNNYAETLVRTLGKEMNGIGSQQEGVLVLKDFFDEIEIENGEVSAFDGSGLSPSTRVTSNAILQLFDYVDSQSWSDIFWNALPESKKDGTLKYRFENAGLTHQVIGKTGTHEFASSLSGKILREDGNILFSVHIYNHPFSTEESVMYVRPIIDKIVAALDRQF